MKALVGALGCGLLFGIGLCISGMADPENILAFLDVNGAWSPNLAGVMVGAIAVHAAWLRWATPPAASSKNDELPTATGKRIDGALVGGAALFGIGWGISGYCPGPAVVALASAAPGALVFVSAMATGMILHERTQWTIKRSGRDSAIHH
ncbi:MAG TPA: DUF6691 family protein [Polyangiaceae bacterium]|nr:DUF6691 family protein [Polyangiaceae bacterium]